MAHQQIKTIGQYVLWIQAQKFSTKYLQTEFKNQLTEILQTLKSSETVQPFQGIKL